MRVALAVLLLPALAGAQDVVLGDAGPSRVGSIVRNALAQPHLLRAGHDPLIFPRDSVYATSLLVLGRPTYLASKVHGDVVVVGADLYLRPGVDVTGRAISIGGTVTRTFLGRVGGTTESYRDDSYAISGGDGHYQLDYRGQQRDRPSVLQLAGVQGLLMPAYHRVDGVSLPVGVLLTLGDRIVEIQPSVTYRSSLGVVDPGVELHVLPEGVVRFEAEIGRSTRTNDRWTYSDLINSAATLAFGNDTRNYFRANGGTARLLGHIETATSEFEPFVGGRYETVSAISAPGTAWALSGRRSVEHMARVNPLVESGTIGSALGGARLTYSAGPVRATLNAEGEKSLRTPDGTSSFAQLTVDGSIDFPTFATQRLRVIAHGVASSGDSVPRSRYAYLGRGSTLPLMELLEQGGDQLIFVDSRYSIPLTGIMLPMAGSPTIFLRHLMGAAGVRTLPKLEQEIGAGIGVSLLRFDVTTDVAGKRKTRFGFGLSMTN